MNTTNRYFKRSRWMGLSWFYFFVTALIVCWAGSALAQVQIVKLKDGNVLRGKVVSKDNGVYKIQTLSLGLVAVAQGDVASIQEAPLEAAAGVSSASSSVAPSKMPASTGIPGVPAVITSESTAPSGSGSSSSDQISEEMDEFRKKIMGDPKAMEAIANLSQDKEIQEVLNDPEIRDALLRQDVEYLKNNEKFLNVSSHPAIQQIVQGFATSSENTEE